jgi:hypothetical protein
MSGTVEMFRGSDRFSCTLPVWEFLWELGRAFGWQPKGTTYIPPPKRKTEPAVRRSYEPGNALDDKQVDEEDAVKWARALTVARGSSHVAAMIDKRWKDAATSDVPRNAAVEKALEGFIEFARRGAFVFSISEE